MDEDAVDAEVSHLRATFFANQPVEFPMRRITGLDRFSMRVYCLVMRGLILFIIGGVLGIIAGAGGMLIAFPFLFPPPPAAEAAPGGTTVSRLGTFRFDDKAPGRDFVHWADGTGAVYQADRMTVLRFDENFKAGPGPNYWIYLNTIPVGEKAAFNADAGRMKIAPLKSFSGGQNFVLPAGIDISKYRTVTIWCESFSVYIGSAALP